MKKAHFQKYPGLGFYSVTTDGPFLYIFVSSVNGGMYKIGTGQNGTKAGKVYLEKPIHHPVGTKVDEVSWVYLKGKIYLKISSKDPWVIEVISPETLEKEGMVQLFCPSLYGQQSLLNLNKNPPLLTDGNNLYCLGSRIRVSKGDHPSKDPTSPKT